MSLRSGRYGINKHNLNWKTGDVRVPTPAGQIVKTFSKDFAMSTTATLHEIEFSFTDFEWDSNYAPVISLLAPAAGYAAILSVNCAYLTKFGSEVTGLSVFVNQSDAGLASDKATLVVAIVNKTT